MKSIRTSISLLFIIGLLGCSQNYGSFGQGSVSTAGLTKNNYRIIKTGVSGESSGFTFLFFTIVPPSASDAKQQMYDQLKAEGIDLRGRAIALANATEDRGGLNLILFGIPTIKLTADIIEFLDEKPNDGQPPGRPPK